MGGNSQATGPQIYPVDVTSVKTTDDGDFIVRGKTDAPKGSKIMAQASADSTDSNDIDNDDFDWVKVDKEGKFVGHITATDVIDTSDKDYSEPRVGDSGKAKLFAVTKVKDKSDYDTIPKAIRKLLKKSKISSYTFTADKKIEKYNKDDESDSSSDSDSDESSLSSDTDSSDKDSSEDYKPITYDALARHPDDNLNKLVQITGTVMQVIKHDGDLQLLVNMDDNPDETVMVIVDESNKPDGEILEHDQVTIKGTAGGKQSYETVLGSDREIPYIDCNETVIDNGKSSDY